eukprot:1099955-Pelagomonas_calceolata.AAC.1
MGMEFLSKFMGPLTVQSKLFELAEGLISIAGPTNTQKDIVESHNLALMSLLRYLCCRCAASNCCPGLVSS